MRTPVSSGLLGGLLLACVWARYGPGKGLQWGPRSPCLDVAKKELDDQMQHSERMTVTFMALMASTCIFVSMMMVVSVVMVISR